MTDLLAGRRVLEFFGLLALGPLAVKKEEQVWPQFTAQQTKKLVSAERPRKNK
jgi:hypothetical protein